MDPGQQQGVATGQGGRPGAKTGAEGMNATGSSSPTGVELDVAHSLNLLVSVICQVNSAVSSSGGEFRSEIRWTRFKSYLFTV